MSLANGLTLDKLLGCLGFIQYPHTRILSPVRRGFTRYNTYTCTCTCRPHTNLVTQLIGTITRSPTHIVHSLNNRKYTMCNNQIDILKPVCMHVYTDEASVSHLVTQEIGVCIDPAQQGVESSHYGRVEILVVLRPVLHGLVLDKATHQQHRMLTVTAICGSRDCKTLTIPYLYKLLINRLHQV